MNIGESLPRNPQHFPNKRAIVDAYRSVTYRELHERTNRLANYLLAHGVVKGDLVGLSCGSRAEHFEALFAAAKIGAAAVPFDFNWSAQECEAIRLDSEQCRCADARSGEAGARYTSG